MQLVKYGSTWCSPCQSLKKTLESVDLSSVEFYEIDIDENPEAASDAKVRGVPTMIIYNDSGEEVSRKVGTLNAIQIKQWLEENVQ